MTFDAIPIGAAVFVDANVLVYYAERHAAFGPACEQLLSRVEHGENQGFTSAHVLTNLTMS